MTHSISLPRHQFEGPLDLLLTLIEEKKLNIAQVALSEVTEQFLAYIKRLETLDAAGLADYLVVAAKLLLIKSKAILPDLHLAQEEQDAGLDLEKQLVLYKQFRDLSRNLKKLSYDQDRQSFPRSRIFDLRVNFFPDMNLTPQTLADAISRVVKNLEALKQLPKARVREAISIQEKISHLQTLLGQRLETKLSLLLSTSKSRHEAIVTFLALLELIKQQILTVEQESLFADITIKQAEAKFSQNL